MYRNHEQGRESCRVCDHPRDIEKVRDTSDRRGEHHQYDHHHIIYDNGAINGAEVDDVREAMVVVEGGCGIEFETTGLREARKAAWALRTLAVR